MKKSAAAGATVDDEVQATLNPLPWVDPRQCVQWYGSIIVDDVHLFRRSIFDSTCFDTCIRVGAFGIFDVSVIKISSHLTIIATQNFIPAIHRDITPRVLALALSRHFVIVLIVVYARTQRQRHLQSISCFHFPTRTFTQTKNTTHIYLLCFDIPRHCHAIADNKSLVVCSVIFQRQR